LNVDLRHLQYGIQDSIRFLLIFVLQHLA